MRELPVAFRTYSVYDPYITEADLPIGRLGMGLGAAALGAGHILYHICNYINFLLFYYCT